MLALTMAVLTSACALLTCCGVTVLIMQGHKKKKNTTNKTLTKYKTS